MDGIGISRTILILIMKDKTNNRMSFTYSILIPIPPNQGFNGIDLGIECQDPTFFFNKKNNCDYIRIIPIMMEF